MGESKLYRIGELAKITNVSPRTIDYYTKMGLIEPESRSESNYRYYSDETLQRLKRIELLKQDKYTLQEIKQFLHQWERVSKKDAVSDKLTELHVHMHQLEKDVKELTPIIEQLKPTQAKSLFKKLTPHSIACIEALLILINKNPFM